jgi:hypothetical protein
VRGKLKNPGLRLLTHTHHRRTSSSLNLLSRAARVDREREHVLFSRTLDKLD